jgi:hypothetical protein
LPPQRPSGGRPGWLLPAIGGVVALVVIGVIVAVLASGGSNDNQQVNNPTSTAAPTSAATVVSRLSPDDLYQALLTTPFRDSELPQGYKAGGVSEGDIDDQDEQHNAIGVVNVSVTPPGTGAGGAIIFTVYPTDEDARGRFDEGLSNESTVTINSTFNPSGFTTPAQGITATYTGSGSKSGVSYCVVLVGSNQVWGVSLLNTDQKKGDNDVACILARAGIEHLKKVQAGQ